MALTIAKMLMRVTGLLTGFLGAGLLYAALAMLMSGWPEQISPLFGMAVLILMLGVAVYFLFVAYATVFSFSPRAVRHLCAVLGFYAFILGVEAFQFTRDSNNAWKGFLYFALVGFVIWVYRVASTRLSRWFFP